jgi:hypothetical protein
MNMAPTDTLVMEPTISMAMLGGTVSPITAAAASTAAPSAAPWPLAQFIAHHGADGGHIGGLRA